MTLICMAHTQKGKPCRNKGGHGFKEKYCKRDHAKRFCLIKGEKLVNGEVEICDKCKEVKANIDKQDKQIVIDKIILELNPIFIEEYHGEGLLMSVKQVLEREL